MGPRYAAILLLALFLTPRAVRSQSINDPIPCSGDAWRREDDTVRAVTLTHLAIGLYALADSARSLTVGDVFPGYFTSAAEIAFRAALYGPDREATLAAAARITFEAATLGEARVDSFLTRRAECYAQRWTRLATQRSDSATTRAAQALLSDIRAALRAERRAAAAARLRRTP